MRQEGNASEAHDNSALNGIFYKDVFIYMGETDLHKEGNREKDLYFSFPKWPPWPELSPLEIRS